MIYKDDYIRHNIETIRNNLETSLKSCGIKAKVSINNGGSAILADNDIWDDDRLYIWIRLLPFESKYYVDISNIILPLRYRRCGVLDIIYKRLKMCKYVSKVVISNPCTNEMHAWIEKHKLSEIGFRVYG